MAYREKKEEEPKYVKNFAPFTQILSHIELAKLDKEIRDNFFEDGMFNEMKLMVAKGALNEKGEVILEGFQYIPHPNPREKGEVIADCYPIKYQEWTSKIEQWKRWLNQTNYYYGNKQEYISNAIEAAAKKIRERL